MVVENNETWREFFEEFRNCPELWHVKSSVYKNKERKNRAWEKLLKIYLKVDSKGTISSLKNKINNIRSCYRRELRKLNQSEKSGAGADDVHQPSLWYFEILDFLRDNEISIEGTSTLDLDDNIEEIEIREECTKSKKSKVSAKKDEFLQKAVDHLSEIRNGRNNKDEAEIFAESWAVMFRKLLPSQKLYAKKAIDEILILGQLNQLTLNTIPSSSMSSYANSPCSQSGSSTPTTLPSTTLIPTQSYVLSRPSSSSPTTFTPHPSQSLILNAHTATTLLPKDRHYYSYQDLFSDQQFS